MNLMIGERIKKYRRERDMTQDELAQVLGVSPQSVSKWECGDGYPDITLLPSIANYFEVTVDELIGNDEISAREDVSNNYFKVVNSLDSSEERLALALKYHKKYPRDWHIANSLMGEITHHHRDKLDEYKPMLQDLCERLLKECTDSVMRRRAIKYMCMICDEDELEKWRNRDTKFYYENCYEIYEERYKLLGDDEQYWMYRKAGNFLRTATTIERLNKCCVINTPMDSLAHKAVYLQILDGVTGQKENERIPDGWIAEYGMVYIRMSAAYFGAGDTEQGYAYLEKALELNERWANIPDGTPLDLGNPLFFGETKLIKQNRHVQLPNGKKLLHLLGIRYYWNKTAVALIMTMQSGWEWFDSVREEPRWKELLERAQKL